MPIHMSNVGHPKLVSLIVGAGLIRLSAFGQSAPVMIQGRVLDSLGQGLSGMTVEAVPDNLNTSRLPASVTDRDGKYSISSQVAGKLRLLAFKESAGYPNTLGVLFTTGSEHFPLIETTGGQTLSNVDILLPEPDGVLSGIVRDTQTGLTIRQARITLRRVDSPELMYSSYINGDGSFLFALPPKPISIEITAPGYKTWHYATKNGTTAYASLEAGSKTDLLVKLEPDVKK
jgi:hypothetical protein